MEAWRYCLQHGLLPLLEADTIGAMLAALQGGQVAPGDTCIPEPLQANADLPVTECCIMALPGLLAHGGFGQATVGQVETAFARLCGQVDARLGQPAATRYLINWFDETPPAVSLPLVAEELRIEIQRRTANG